MKIYTNTFDLSRPSPHRFWVSPYSDFKFGIKLVNAGAEVQNDFTVAAGTTELTPDEDKIDGFTIFTAKSADTGFVEYTIDVADIVQKFKLVQIITDSTVFEVGGEGGGGDVPADVATKTWVSSQISDFITDDALTAYATKDYVDSATSSFVEEGELTAYATKDELTGYVETDDLTAYAEKTDLTAYATKAELTGYVENGDLTAYYTKSETSSAAEISTALGGKQPAGNYLTAETEPAFAAMSADIVVDGDLTAYYTKSETSSAAEISSGLVSKVTGGAETGTTGTPAAITAVKSVYETDWATLSASAISSTFYVVLPDPA